MKPRVHINAALAGSALSLLAVLVVAVISLPVVARAGLGSSLSEEGVGDVFARLMEEHEESSSTYCERFNGRSVFFKPRQPRAPRPKVVREPPTVSTNKEQPPPPPPPPPSRPPYSGPDVGGIIGNSVFFRGDLRVSVGETLDGMTVVSVDPPWSVKVEHRGWEYDVPLFDRGTEAFFGTGGDAPEQGTTLRGFVTENADNGASATARQDDDESLSPRDVEVPARVPMKPKSAGAGAVRKKTGGPRSTPE